MSAARQIAEFLAEYRNVMVITGAGCSTGSGIDDYRDREGQWKRAQPVQHQDFVSSVDARRRYWARSMLGWPVVAAAEPNAAHLALADLQRSGCVQRLVTQNVDGLHQRAGSQAVIDLHGRLDRVRCMSCGTLSSRQVLQEQLVNLNPSIAVRRFRAAPDGDADVELCSTDVIQVPECERCGGFLKPDVVFYGDSVPKPVVADVFAATEAADALLVVGSSLMVFSSFRFCRKAHEQRTPMAAINLGKTRADEWFATKVEADCTEVLPAVVTRMEGLRTGDRITQRA